MVQLILALLNDSDAATNIAISDVRGGEVGVGGGDEERRERRVERPFALGTRTGYDTPGSWVIPFKTSAVPAIYVIM